MNELWKRALLEGKSSVYQQLLESIQKTDSAKVLWSYFTLLCALREKNIATKLLPHIAPHANYLYDSGVISDNTIKSLTKKDSQEVIFSDLITHNQKHDKSNETPNQANNFIIQKMLIPYLGKGKVVVELTCSRCGSSFRANVKSDYFQNQKGHCPNCLHLQKIEKKNLADICRNTFETHIRSRFLMFFSENSQRCGDQTRQAQFLLSSSVALQDIFPIYFVKIWTNRIGHLVLNPSILLARLKKEGKENALIFGFPAHPNNIANKYLLQLWTQHMVITPLAETVYSTLNTIPQFKHLLIDLTLRENSCDKYGVLDNSTPPFTYTKIEHATGLKWLEKQNINPQNGYVCFLGRDPLYLEKQLKNISTRYHDHRNIDFKSYTAAMEWLSTKKIASLRMGSVVQEQFKHEDPLIIDYASHHHSEFLDLYLSSHCLFYVSCVTGPDVIPLVMRKPVLFANMPTVLSIHHYADPLAMIIFKKIKCRKSGKLLSFREICERGLGVVNTAEELDKNEVDMIDNSMEELLTSVQEMYERTLGTWVVSEEEKALQHKFAELLKEYSPDRAEFSATIGFRYLQMNDFLL
ncbi:TIGR04372 family glycosyltransferase [Maridesulfovibrio salexigens]|uniref:Uncharacterized protein n=1 Tax=Maridesulfovibrio salexigens (strain ATCC 14822 / DSM 2638 / NCIMB 8403 / VKM B-1763) TaxID=526222 RepID=C6BZM9_MARSD|nr:TIGR04372 family glycosyltransferase [Maridesulfovibrio salexigens]ACS78936.1 hypothetical protein Desal_0870 [Maridesulfovibrio salexigens DSM 2638]